MPSEVADSVILVSTFLLRASLCTVPLGSLRYFGILHCVHTFENNTSGNFGELSACCFENRGAWTFSTNEQSLRNFGELIACCYMFRVVSSFIASPSSDNIARECVLGSFYGVGFVRKNIALDQNFGFNVGFNAMLFI